MHVPPRYGDVMTGAAHHLSDLGSPIELITSGNTRGLLLTLTKIVICII